MIRSTTSCAIQKNAPSAVFLPVFDKTSARKRQKSNLGAPKNGHEYQIVLVCRVSSPGPGKQDVRSLDDQDASHREWLSKNVLAPYKLEVIAGDGSGELIDRADYLRLIELIATRQFDLVLTEDLGRIARRIHAHLICEHCEDHDTRLIAKNDRVDTTQPGWRDGSIFSAFHHERSNRDTSERIKRTHRNRFANGGCIRQPGYGWVKPPGAKADALMTKDPAAEPIYAEWFRMLDQDQATFAEIARWLRNQEVTFPTRSPGVYAAPDGKSVARHTFNVLLKGIRERNRRKTRRINNPGKYVSEKADPSELLQRVVPHLAFFAESFYDRVVAAVKARNERYRRSESPGENPCLRRPKRQTRFPGQLTACEICGRWFVWGGHGQTDHLMCSGARDHRCWNGVTFDGTLASEKIAAAVYAAIEQLVGFDPEFLRIVHAEAARLDGDRHRRLTELRRQFAAADGEVTNLVKFVRTGGDSLAVREDLRRAEQERARLGASIKSAEAEPTNEVQIPDMEQIKQRGHDCLARLDVRTEEFARVMRRLVPKVSVFPVQLCDGGAVTLRANVKVLLSELLDDRRARDVLREPLTRTLCVDLFKLPQRAEFRERIVASRGAGTTEKAVATELGITVAAAQRAVALQRRMDELGIADPYVRVTAPPADDAKRRRHLHPDYRFEPLPVSAA